MQARRSYLDHTAGGGRARPTTPTATLKRARGVAGRLTSGADHSLTQRQGDQLE